jgi:large subunit ribosomal protein L21
MFAIVEVAGFQYRVQKSDVLTVPVLVGKEVGSEVSFKVLAAGEGSSLKVGAPYLQGSVTAKVTSHGKAEKVIVFHKKRRKGYRKRNGHRQHTMQVEITNIAV